MAQHKQSTGRSNIKGRRALNRERTIADILAAAQEIMRTEGVAALNLNEVARRVGMKTPSLYEYFPNKLAIYDAMFLHGTHVFASYMRDARQANQSFWECTQAMIEAYMSFAHDRPELYQLVLERPVPGFVPSEASMAESRALLEEAVSDIAARLPQEVSRSGLTPEHVTDLIIAVMHGLTALQMANEPHAPVGAGRFGSLIPAAVSMFRAAWSTQDIPGENGNTNNS